MMRFAALSAEWNSLCEIACKDSVSFKEMQNEIVRLKGILAKRANDKGKKKVVNKIIGDPIYVKTKGAPPKRKKKWNKRTCSNCGRGGHDIRTCGQLRNGNGGGGGSSDSGSSSSDSRGDNSDFDGLGGDTTEWYNEWSETRSGIGKSDGVDGQMTTGSIGEDGSLNLTNQSISDVEGMKRQCPDSEEASTLCSRNVPEAKDLMGMRFKALELMLLMEKNPMSGNGNGNGNGKGKGKRIGNENSNGKSKGKGKGNGKGNGKGKGKGK